MKTPWFIKYRPKTIDEYIFSSEEAKAILTKYIEDEDIPNMLLSGIQGTGKTTIARILINELGIQKNDVRVVNASSNNGIANVRNNIETFVKTAGLSKFKIVLLEEADGLSHDAQKALRWIIEDYLDKGVRFILTCNYPNKLIPAIHSRITSHIHIKELDKETVLERVVEILEREQIEVDELDYIQEHIDTYYPDMRKIINSLQQSSETGKLIGVIGKSDTASDNEQWEECWTTNPNKDDLVDLVRSMEIDNTESIYRTMYDNVKNLPEDKQMNAFVVIADHLYRSAFVADQEINLFACVINIFDE